MKYILILTIILTITGCAFNVGVEFGTKSVNTGTNTNFSLVFDSKGMIIHE